MHTLKKIVLLFMFISLNLFSLTRHVRMSSAWHPGKKVELLKSMQKHDNTASLLYDMELNSSDIRAIIVPHASFDYSGDVAAAAYRLIKPGIFKRVVLLAPSHYDSFTGVALPDTIYDMYKTPLGMLPLDVRALNHLADKELFAPRPSAHQLEHAIAVQLPFIQKYCGFDCKLIPLLVGNVNESQVLSVAESLKALLDHETLLIISSDLTHYGKRFSYTPFKDNITQKIFELDSSIVAEIEKQNLKGFIKRVEKSGATICGFSPLMVLLGLLKQDTFRSVDSYIVGYDTSASDQKNPDHSVSYLSCIFSNQMRKDLPVRFQLTGYEKSALLRFARQYLQTFFDDSVEGVSKKAEFPGLLTEGLRRKQGVFVSSYSIDQNGNKSLRGCMGTLSQNIPLYKSVQHMTKQAALYDSRFKPIRGEDLDSVQLSISVLTPLVQIPSFNDIELGRDGIVFKQGACSAVFLPKVPFDQGWSLQTTLSALAQKAGLDKHAYYHPDTTFEVFQSIDFAEPKDNFFD